MENNCTLTPNPKLPGSDMGWNCTSADGEIEVYGETKAEATANLEVAQLTQKLADQNEAMREMASAMAMLSARLDHYEGPQKAALSAEKLRADALHEALSELVDGIEDAGGHDENGDVFDIGKAVAALALGGKEQK